MGMGFRAGFAGVTCVAFLVACGATIVDQQAAAGGGSGGSSDDAGSAGDSRAGHEAGGNPNAGRAGSSVKGGATGASGTTASGGSKSSAGASGADNNVPLDTRPPRPAWNPPFALGAPGWKQSTELLCEKHQGDQYAFDVWADSRGVFGLFGAACNVLAGTSCGKQGVSLQFNDGTGWRVLYAVPPGPGMGSPGAMFLSGFDSGALLLSGFLPDELAIWRITQAGKVTLDAPLPADRLFTVGKGLAYALGYSKLGQTILPDVLLRLVDGQWAHYLTLPALAENLWADEDRIVVVGPDQAVYEKSQNDADFVAIPGVPAGEYGAVWSFGPNDTWLGNRIGQLLHYDGSKWTVIETGSTDASGRGIAQLWGSSDGQLFFRTYNGMGRYDGEKVELLINVDTVADSANARVSTGGMWGLSSKEVFLSVTDWKFDQYACGGEFMLFFDGKTFHMF